MKYKDFINELVKCEKFIKNEQLRTRISNIIKSPVCLNRLFEKYEKQTLSLVMLVKDQEKIIEKVIDKISNFDIDEFIVVDTGSSDNTVNILKSKEYVQLKEISWVENYAEMRNKAASFSSSRWALALDSDEIMISSKFSLKVLITLLEYTISEPFAINFEDHSPGRSEYGIPDRLYCCEENEYFGLVHEEIRNKKTHEAIRSIATRVQIENEGAVEEEVIKFNKRERYTELLNQMILQEPENPRWICFITSLGMRDKMESGEYEGLLSKHLFKDGKYSEIESNIKIHKYTNILMERYISLLLITERYAEAQKLIEVGLKLYPGDIPLLFFKIYARAEEIKQISKKALKSTLSTYLSLDKQELYDKYYRDTQLIETGIAELEILSGNYDIAQKIMSKVTDKKSNTIFYEWNINEMRETK